MLETISFKIIVAGSRGITDYALVEKAIKLSNFQISEVVSGKAAGVDTLGELYAKNNNIPITHFPANWDKFGKSAGYLRNVEMGEYADGAVILWDGFSKGTKHMLETMSRLKKPIYLVFINESHVHR